MPYPESPTSAPGSAPVPGSTRYPGQALARSASPALMDAPQYLPAVDPQAVEQAMMIGDLSQMTPEVRIAYYVATCRSLGLNPLTRPFQALKTDDGQVLLYPDKGCAEQLRKRDGISLRTLSREYVDDLYIVTVEARTTDGRLEEAEGAVAIMESVGTWEEGTKRNGDKYRYKNEKLGPDGKPLLKRLTGTAMANARMRAESKAKRRVTLAICGLGMPDEGAHPMRFDVQSGALRDGATLDDTVDLETGEVTEVSGSGSLVPGSGSLVSGASHQEPGTSNQEPTSQASSDLYGPTSQDLQQAQATAARPLRPEWAQMSQWYADAGRWERYDELLTWACKQFGVQVVQDIPLADVMALSVKVHEQLAPLIAARHAQDGAPPMGLPEDEEPMPGAEEEKW